MHADKDDFFQPIPEVNEQFDGTSSIATSRKKKKGKKGKKKKAKEAAALAAIGEDMLDSPMQSDDEKAASRVQTVGGGLNSLNYDVNDKDSTVSHHNDNEDQRADNLDN